MHDLLDAALGVTFGAAVGDALGAGYEYGCATPPPTGRIPHIGGGLGRFAIAEWTDDTTMAIPILHHATRADLMDERTQHSILIDWCQWASRGPKDIGVHTAMVLAHGPDRAAAQAKAFWEGGKPSGGNGSLMRTWPVALAYMDKALDDDTATRAAAALSALTHADPLAMQASALWTEMIRGVLVTGHLDPAAALDHLPGAVGAFWAEAMDEAEQSQPSDFANGNGYVLRALQGAWSAIAGTSDYRGAVEAAIRGGGDTDTVASIAGALAGAVYGVSGIPADLMMGLHGEGADVDDLDRWTRALMAP